MNAEEFAKAIARANDLRRMADQYQKEAKEILDSLDIYGEEREYPAGNFIVKVLRTRRFDPVQAERNLTPEEFQSTLVTRPDSAQAKRVLSPERYSLAQREYDWSVRISPVTEDDE